MGPTGKTTDACDEKIHAIVAREGGFGKPKKKKKYRVCFIVGEAWGDVWKVGLGLYFAWPEAKPQHVRHPELAGEYKIHAIIQYHPLFIN